MKPIQLLLVMLVIVLAGCASRNEQACTFLNPERRGSNGSTNEMLEADILSAVAVADNYAYVGVKSGLLILDVRDASNVRQVGKLFLSGGVQSLDVHGQYVYTTGREHHIVDVSDPVQPREVKCQEGSTVPAVAGGTLAEGFAYARDPEDGSLNIYEVDSESVVQVASYQSSAPVRFRLYPEPNTTT